MCIKCNMCDLFTKGDAMHALPCTRCLPDLGSLVLLVLATNQIVRKTLPLEQITAVDMVLCLNQLFTPFCDGAGSGSVCSGQIGSICDFWRKAVLGGVSRHAPDHGLGRQHCCSNQPVG